ncbi:hypothetical protein EX30DRAFT_337286 [Ascodesmis nigricans]|uniref:EKC/KEOPS complex subunit GON7 n=1 Tax=Ascodesmis nigricans TaxID=341454 RepID=A0A4S2N673_9PEZI|nr:hypothetical protein EX30DRAFT_337286 [Ascodesmis nigricans]
MHLKTFRTAPPYPTSAACPAVHLPTTIMPPLPAEQATAVYTSPLPPPSDSKIFTYQLPEAISDTTRLGILKEVVEKLQADVNAYLTERMEEEKQAELAAGKKGQVREEEEEEENYGEEVVEED